MSKIVDRLNKPAWRHTLTAVSSVMAALGILAAAAWTIGEPHADRFVKQVVAQAQYVNKSELSGLEKDVDHIRRDVEGLENKTQTIERQQRENGAKLDLTIQLQRETRSLLNQILLIRTRRSDNR